MLRILAESTKRVHWKDFHRHYASSAYICGSLCNRGKLKVACAASAVRIIACQVQTRSFTDSKSSLSDNLLTNPVDKNYFVLSDEPGVILSEVPVQGSSTSSFQSQSPEIEMSKERILYGCNIDDPKMNSINILHTIMSRHTDVIYNYTTGRTSSGLFQTTFEPSSVVDPTYVSVVGKYFSELGPIEGEPFQTISKSQESVARKVIELYYNNYQTIWSMLSTDILQQPLVTSATVSTEVNESENHQQQSGDVVINETTATLAPMDDNSLTPAPTTTDTLPPQGTVFVPRLFYGYDIDNPQHTGKTILHNIITIFPRLKYNIVSFKKPYNGKWVSSFDLYCRSENSILCDVEKCLLGSVTSVDSNECWTQLESQEDVARKALNYMYNNYVDNWKIRVAHVPRIVFDVNIDNPYQSSEDILQSLFHLGGAIEYHVKYKQNSCEQTIASIQVHAPNPQLLTNIGKCLTQLHSITGAACERELEAHDQVLRVALRTCHRLYQRKWRALLGVEHDHHVHLLSATELLHHHLEEVHTRQPLGNTLSLHRSADNNHNTAKMGLRVMHTSATTGEGKDVDHPTSQASDDASQDPGLGKTGDFLTATEKAENLAEKTAKESTVKRRFLCSINIDNPTIDALDTLIHQYAKLQYKIVVKQVLDTPYWVAEFNSYIHDKTIITRIGETVLEVGTVKGDYCETKEEAKENCIARVLDSCYEVFHRRQDPQIFYDDSSSTPASGSRDKNSTNVNTNTYSSKKLGKGKRDPLFSFPQIGMTTASIAGVHPPQDYWDLQDASYGTNMENDLLKDYFRSH